MYELRVEVEFSAAHHLEGYPGDCARPHGHNFVVEVLARSQGLDSIGLALDFRTLKGAAKELIAGWDHQDLNQHPDFATINPSAEEIARLVYDRLSALIDRPQAAKATWIHKVVIWENARSSAAYFDPTKVPAGS